MSAKSEITAMAQAIIEAHAGQAYYNFEQASKIIGCGRNTLAHHLHSAGILVKKVGPSKRVSAYDLASCMYSGRIAPIDNISRSA